MKRHQQNLCSTLVAALSLSVLAGCGDPGGVPPEGPDEDTSLIETLELSFRDQSLVTFDPAVESYAVDVNVLVDEVTFRAVPRDLETELVMTQDGLVLPLEDGEAVIRLGSGATTLELEATQDKRAESYLIDIHRGELPFEESYVKAPSAAAGATFGSAVALSGDTLAVGAPAAMNPAPAVFVYQRGAGGWTATATVRGLRRRRTLREQRPPGSRRGVCVRSLWLALGTTGLHQGRVARDSGEFWRCGRP
jgi:hypothetical protein